MITTRLLGCIWPSSGKQIRVRYYLKAMKTEELGRDGERRLPALVSVTLRAMQHRQSLALRRRRVVQGLRSRCRSILTDYRKGLFQFRAYPNVCIQNSIRAWMESSTTWRRNEEGEAAAVAAPVAVQ